MTAKLKHNNETKQYHWPVEFKRIATAVAFSPTALAVMHEAVRIARKFNAFVYFIHAGKKNPESEEKLEELLTKLNCNKNFYEVVWRDEEPTPAILNACKDKDVDLLIAGALQKENLVQFYKGSIARKLCRKADCSLLLLTHPEIESKPCNKIVVNGLHHPKTDDTIRTAFYVANAFEAKKVTVVEEVAQGEVGIHCDDDLSLAQAKRKKANIARDEHARITRLVKGFPVNDDVQIKEQCLFGKKGYSIAHYAQQNHADLMIMNSPDTKLGFFDRVFTHDLEYVLADLPSDLLLVHSTRKTT